MYYVKTFICATSAEIADYLNGAAKNHSIISITQSETGDTETSRSKTVITIITRGN